MMVCVSLASSRGADGSVFRAGFRGAPGRRVAGEVPRTTISLFTRHAAASHPVLLGFCHSVRCTTSSNLVAVSRRGISAQIQSVLCMRQRTQRAARLSRRFNEGSDPSQVDHRRLRGVCFSCFLIASSSRRRACTSGSGCASCAAGGTATSNASNADAGVGVTF
jgi:hypothetical protein